MNVIIYEANERSIILFCKISDQIFVNILHNLAKLCSVAVFTGPATSDNPLSLVSNFLKL